MAFLLALFLAFPFLPALASEKSGIAGDEGEGFSAAMVGEDPWKVTSLDIWKDVKEVRAPGWSIDLEKTASVRELEMMVGETREVTFTITVEATPGDSYYLAGNIFVRNTGEWPAEVIGVSDTVWYKAGGPAWLPATSSITTTVPLGDDAIPTGGPHVYSYSGTFTLPVPPDSVTALSNLIEITISNKPNPPRPGMQDWTFHSREGFAMPTAGGMNPLSLSDVEWMIPAEGLDYEIESVTINGSPTSSLTGPWELDVGNAPYTVVVQKDLNASKPGEYTLHNKAVLDGLEDEVEVEILVRDREPGTGEILGYKYQDIDLDGELDPDDPPWEKITIELWKDGVKTDETITSSDGSFLFTGLEEDDYEVREVLPEGTAAVGFTIRWVEVVAGETSSLSEPFLNYLVPMEKGGIGGTKYLDLDADGVLDGDETGLAGVTVRLFRAAPGDLGPTGFGFLASYLSWIEVGQAVTDENGEFSFLDLDPGIYLVTEEVPEGYFPTSEQEYQLELEAGEEIRVFFLNAPLAAVAGFKWLDLNGDGLADENEPGLAGITINLLDGEGEILDARVTTAEGYYLFDGLLPGEYAVEEVVPEGYLATSPAKVSFDLLPGEERRVDFLNAVEVAGEVVTPPVTPPLVPIVGGGSGTLPATGFAMTMLLVAAGLLLGAGTLALLLGAKRARRAA
ncbi:MAG: MSCRAMM family protein [Actinomycetota bacterium]